MEKFTKMLYHNTRGLVFEHRKKDYYIIAFVLSSSLIMMKNILITGSELLYEKNASLNIGLMFVCALIYIYAIIKQKKAKLNCRSFLILLTVIIFWLISMLTNKELLSYSYVLEDISSFVIYSLPAFFFLPMIKDYKKFIDEYHKIRHVFLIVIFISVILIMNNGYIQGSENRYLMYSMSFGRALIFPTILYFSAWFNTGKIKDLLCAIIISLFVLLFGSRFPLLCIGSFVIYKLIINRSIYKYKIYIMIFLFMIIFLIILFDYQIIDGISEYILSKFGIRSRSLSVLLAGDIGNDSGRSLIHNELMIHLKFSPIIGYGAGGSIVVLNNTLPHSIVLDIFGNFGFLFGSLFIFMQFYIFANYIG